jgi:hypothetical protein
MNVSLFTNMILLQFRLMTMGVGRLKDVTATLLVVHMVQIVKSLPPGKTDLKHSSLKWTSLFTQTFQVRTSGLPWVSLKKKTEW